mmetsp:Transcript_77554/g.130151  ORF Transcript_77554/g.130151 Transcript_77554/m.130151 type:complete len:249 (+) Transcript_77554:1072-1818(+)
MNPWLMNRRNVQVPSNFSAATRRSYQGPAISPYAVEMNSPTATHHVLPSMMPPWKRTLDPARAPVQPNAMPTMAKRAARLFLKSLNPRITRHEMMEPGTSTRKKKEAGGGALRPREAVKMSWLKKSRKLRSAAMRVRGMISASSPGQFSRMKPSCSGHPTALRWARCWMSSSEGFAAGHRSASVSSRTAAGRQTSPSASGITWYGMPMFSAALAVARLAGPAKEYRPVTVATMSSVARRPSRYVNMPP